MSVGIAMIAVERRRQIEAEGWTPEHDAEHVSGELLTAAVEYVRCAEGQVSGVVLAGIGECWPWDAASWKPSDDPIRNLVKAGALIAAEIDRLRRRDVV